MGIESNENRDRPNVEITLRQDDDGWLTARDETRGLTTQGETRDEALSNLDDLIDTVENDAGRPLTEEELQEVGVDPEANRQAGNGELPDVLK